MSTFLRPKSRSLTKYKKFQPDTEGVDRRARSSHPCRVEGGHKTLLAVSVLAPGAPVLPIKLWESHGCNEVQGTKVAITAQLNCHQRLMEAQVQTLANCKYLQIQSEAETISQHAAASQNHDCRCVSAVWNIFRRCRVDSPVWLKPLWRDSKHPQASAS